MCIQEGSTGFSNDNGANLRLRLDKTIVKAVHGRKMERTDNRILRLSKGDQRGVEGSWSAVSIIRLVCWQRS